MFHITQCTRSQEQDLLDLAVASQLYQKQLLEQKSVDEEALAADTAKLVRQSLRSDECAYFIATDDNRLLGFVLAEMTKVQAEQGWINDLYVIPEFRGQGVSAELMKHAEKWLATKGVKRITLSVHNSNSAAMSLYHKLGDAESPLHYIELTKTVKHL